MIREAEMVLFREAHNIRLSNIKWSALKTHASNIILTESLVFRNIYVNTYIYDYTHIYDDTCMLVSMIKNFKNFK